MDGRAGHRTRDGCMLRPLPRGREQGGNAHEMDAAKPLLNSSLDSGFGFGILRRSRQLLLHCSTFAHPWARTAYIHVGVRWNDVDVGMPLSYPVDDAEHWTEQG